MVNWFIQYWIWAGIITIILVFLPKNIINETINDNDLLRYSIKGYTMIFIFIIGFILFPMALLFELSFIFYVLKYYWLINIDKIKKYPHDRKMRKINKLYNKLLKEKTIKIGT